MVKIKLEIKLETKSREYRDRKKINYKV